MTPPTPALFVLLMAAVAAATAMTSGTEDNVRRACSRTLHFDPCLSHTTSAGKRKRLNSLPQVQREAVRVARRGIALARGGWAAMSTEGFGRGGAATRRELAWRDCVQLYDDSEHRLKRLAGKRRHHPDDAHTWLSGALTSHGSCLDGLRESGSPVPHGAENLTAAISTALALYALAAEEETASNATRGKAAEGEGEALVSEVKPHLTVAKDGSGNYRTIKEAVAEIQRWEEKRPARVVVYVKSGQYEENVAIDRDLSNITFVGDGMDKTVVSGSRNFVDGSTTYASATFGVSGDGFWARDMTFENTAGPGKHQAVALRVGSDHSIFYRCSFKGCQDTLFLHSQRQFYRDCDVHGTIDFIFGNAAAVLQNCNIFVRNPMAHQSNMITAQGRDDPNQNTGISIHGCRIAAARDFEAVKGSVHSFLGRPWKRYSRTVVMKTDMDRLIHPRGWAPWSGDFALSTLFYGEYMNSGEGAQTGGRVDWPGFHVLRDDGEAMPFSVSKFIQGDSWIAAAGVPFLSGI